MPETILGAPVNVMKLAGRVALAEIVGGAVEGAVAPLLAEANRLQAFRDELDAELCEATKQLPHTVDEETWRISTCTERILLSVQWMKEIRDSSNAMAESNKILRGELGTADKGLRDIQRDIANLITFGNGTSGTVGGDLTILRSFIEEAKGWHEKLHATTAPKATAASEEPDEPFKNGGKWWRKDGEPRPLRSGDYFIASPPICDVMLAYEPSDHVRQVVVEVPSPSAPPAAGGDYRFAEPHATGGTCWVTVTKEQAIAWQRAAGKQRGYEYESDERALEDFLVVNWAETVPPAAEVGGEAADTITVNRAELFKLLHAYGPLVNVTGERVDTKQPGHGSCCTCQQCGHDNDSCVCLHNEFLEEFETFVSSQPPVTAKGTGEQSNG